MKSSKFIALLVIVLALVATPLSSHAAASDSITIMAAATTAEAVTELAKAYQQQTGVEVKIVTGNSVSLSSQIIADAPADLFLSASQEWADKVREKGYVAQMQPLLSSDLVLIVPAGNPAKVKTPADLTSAAVTKLALACEHGPCGRFGQQALGRLGLFDELVKQNKLVRGHDVRISLSYVERGEAEAGIVFATDARLSSKVEVVHVFDHKTYDPVSFPLVLLKSGAAKPEAARFYQTLLAPKSLAVFARYGFICLKPDGK